MLEPSCLLETLDSSACLQTEEEKKAEEEAAKKQAEMMEMMRKAQVRGSFPGTRGAWTDTCSLLGSLVHAWADTR